MDLIPAIDIIDGKCVRLTQGDYAQKKIYDQDPLSVALRIQDAGLNKLHLVDLDGARSKCVVNLGVLQSIAGGTNLEIDFGGGVKTSDDLKRVFEAGASQVTGGSIAVKDPDLFSSWLMQYGADRIILGADVRDGMLLVHGWQQTTEVKLWAFLEKYQQIGVRRVICTDVSKDGLLKGPAIDLYRNLVTDFPQLYIIASGGVSTIKDLEALQLAGVAGAIIGKALYEGQLTLKTLSNFI